jgi:hypothetical protein
MFITLGRRSNSFLALKAPVYTIPIINAPEHTKRIAKIAMSQS